MGGRPPSLRIEWSLSHIHRLRKTVWAKTMISPLYLVFSWRANRLDFLRGFPNNMRFFETKSIVEPVEPVEPVVDHQPNLSCQPQPLLEGWCSCGSIPHHLFRGIKIHKIKAILMWTDGVAGFDSSPCRSAVDPRMYSRSGSWDFLMGFLHRSVGSPRESQLPSGQSPVEDQRTSHCQSCHLSNGLEIPSSMGYEWYICNNIYIWYYKYMYTIL